MIRMYGRKSYGSTTGPQEWDRWGGLVPWYTPLKDARYTCHTYSHKITLIVYDTRVQTSRAGYVHKPQRATHATCNTHVMS